MARQHGYIGRCPVKGCGHVARQLGAFSRPARCPEHEQRITLEPVWGELVETVRCDARCQNARGASCDCSCGGANHGRGHLEAVQTAISVQDGQTTVVDAVAITASPVSESMRLFEPAPVQMPGQLDIRVNDK
jgi:hypothetical protein